MPASRHQDHTTSPSAFDAFVFSHGKRPPRPAPNVRDDSRSAPPCEARDGGNHEGDLRSRSIFTRCGKLTRRANQLPQENTVKDFFASRTRSSASLRAASQSWDPCFDSTRMKQTKRRTPDQQP